MWGVGWRGGVHMAQLACVELDFVHISDIYILGIEVFVVGV